VAGYGENWAGFPLGNGICIERSVTNSALKTGTNNLPGKKHGPCISADTFKDERARNPDGDPHCKVTLRVGQTALTERQASLEIRPGMQAEVELQTGGKTIFSYLTKPLYKSGEALRER
jgi:hypothetical protein